MRVILGALVGAILVFAASAVLHMVSPLGEWGIKTLPSEQQTVDALRSQVPSSGLYMFPGEGMMGSEADQKRWQEALRRGPQGILVISSGGQEVMEPQQLVMELVTTFIAALIAAIVLANLAASYGMRVIVVALLALFAFFSVSASHWIWYKYPLEFVGGELAMELIAWVLAGLAMAKIIRPRVVPAR